MPVIHINYLALLVATVAGFFLSFIWYTPLFGKAWAKEMGFDLSEKPPTPAMVKSLLLTFLGVALIAYVMAFTIAAWTPSTWGVTGAQVSKYWLAFQGAFYTWLGFYVSHLLMGIAWEKRSWKLFAIDAGYYLSLLLLVSLIIVFMG